MPVFEIYRADGSLQINLASKMTRILGEININYSQTGSLYDERIKTGTPFWTELSNFSPGPSSGNLQPRVVIDKAAGTISWTTRGGVSVTPMVILYGIYSNG